MAHDLSPHQASASSSGPSGDATADGPGDALRLSPEAVTALYAHPAAQGNITLIHIYNQQTAPGGAVRFKNILAHIDRRLDKLPMFRRKIQRVPLNLDRPYWVDDEDFDLEFHVRHLALPKPGDWRQFCIQVSRLHARALDLQRPLWEIYVLEGLDAFIDLPPGSFALITKTHQAAIDAEHGVELTQLLHDTSPAPAKAAPPKPWFAAPPPGQLAVLARGVINTVKAPLASVAPLSRLIWDWAPTAVSWLGEALRAPQTMPVTRFNAAISPYRVFETRRFKLDEIRAIRTLVPGATVHDVVLAIIGGALRNYLIHHAELPQGDLQVMVPMYLHKTSGKVRSQQRTSGRKARADRELTWVRTPLGTEQDDPVARLDVIRKATGGADLRARGVSARDLTDLQQHAPAATLVLAGKLLGMATAGLGKRSPLANCNVTNVPGPKEPLYLCGARMTYFSAMMPIADGMGLSLAVTSYDDWLIISPTSCRELMPDPDRFASCLRDSYQQYVGLLVASTVAATTVAATTMTEPKPKRKTAAKAKPEPTATATDTRRGRPRTSA